MKIPKRLEHNAARFRLSKREIEVFTLVADGETHKGVGGELGISSFTVARYVLSARLKMRVHVP